ncbi:MAG: pyridoxal phosphate-dependent aminotransferase [Tenericutes bacterium HGW-Tenericutes-1]|jgi:aspartate/methionine/tyrosine aminotransferase|nr:MAG: pyridoxal phosphate-dependent aminotransferase [Tenericutes bacterium HGW-Tenericutes-1]
MDVKLKMNQKFSDLQGGLFLEVTKADVGEGVGKLLEKGYKIMAWADPFFPDPAIPNSVKDAMIKAIEGGFPAHYSMPIGLFDLRQEIAKKVERQTRLKINPSRNVIVAPGSDSGLLYSMMPFINEGDEVLITDPSYPSNFLNPKLLGGVAVHVPLYEEDNYQIRIEEFEKRLTPKTKMVLITHPNNPTTTVFRRESIEKLCDFIVKNDLILVSDQAFEDHIYDDIEFVIPATLPGMWERTVTVCSISKGIGLSGLRIGYIYADDKIMDVLYGGAVNVLGAASTVSSIGAIAALKDEEHLKVTYERLERRRRLAYEVFSKIPGVTLSMPESGILCWLNVSKLGTAKEASAQILEDAHILVNEGTPYGFQGEGHLRIVIACFNDDNEAVDAFNRIASALTKLANQKGIN